MIDRRRRALPWYSLTWLVSLVGIAACWYFDAHWLFWTFAIIGFVSGAIQHSADLSQYYEWRRRLAILQSQDAGEPSVADE